MKQYINIPIMFLQNYTIIRYRQNTNMEKNKKNKKKNNVKLKIKIKPNLQNIGKIHTRTMLCI